MKLFYLRMYPSLFALSYFSQTNWSCKTQYVNSSFYSWKALICLGFISDTPRRNSGTWPLKLCIPFPLKLGWKHCTSVGFTCVSKCVFKQHRHTLMVSLEIFTRYNDAKVISIQYKPCSRLWILIFPSLVIFWATLSSGAGQWRRARSPSRPRDHEDKQPIHVHPRCTRTTIVVSTQCSIW